MTETAILDIAMKYGVAGVSLALIVVLFLTVKMFLDFVKTINVENNKRDSQHLKMYNKLGRIVTKTYEYQKLQNGSTKIALEAVKVSICDSAKALKGLDKTIQKIADKK